MYRETGVSGIDIELIVDKAREEFTYQAGDWDGINVTYTAGELATLVDVDLLLAEGGTGDNYFDFSSADVHVHLVGGDGNDWLIGGSRGDVFVGGLGDDAIFGNGGIDEVILLASRYDQEVKGESVNLFIVGKDKAFEGKVKTVDPIIDAASNTFAVTLSLDDLVSYRLDLSAEIIGWN